MKLENKIPIALQFTKAKLFKRRIPVIVSWAITYRCKQNCSYCQWPRVYSEEEVTF
ncbi:MAG: hypothetical protein KJ893_04675 [Candidatus Omnitrophica bacterium]|nr:hypothetical protein [Candidatus Omnitrophota bacterium]MBU4478024.1 hypothetical protein [Candidatus Omnitrophota bacterium]MCG2703632.1 hypothetical protein [Candidatus Omnitrophota bacterium]